MSGNHSQPVTARRTTLATITRSLTRKARRTIIAGATTGALAAGLLAAAAGPASANLPPLIISYSAYNFGGVSLAASNTVTFTVINNTSFQNQLATSFSGSPEFSVVNNGSSCVNVVYPDSPCTLVLRFAPTTLGSATTQLKIVGSMGGAVIVPLSGAGTANVFWSNVVSYMIAGSGTISEAAANGTAAPQNFATGQSEPAGLASDNSHMYWAGYGNGTIVESNLDGSNAHTIISGQNMPWGVAVNGSNLYWTDLGGGTVMEANLDGTGAHAIETGQGDPAGITLDGSHIYWVNYTGHTIMQANLDGSNPQAIVSGRSAPMGVAVTSSHIYWTELYNGTIMEANLDGTNVQQFTRALGRPAGIAIDAGTIFWVDEDNYTADETSGMVQSANLDGSNAQTLASGQPLPWGLAVR